MGPPVAESLFTHLPAADSSIPASSFRLHPFWYGPRSARNLSAAEEVHTLGANRTSLIRNGPLHAHRTCTPGHNGKPLSTPGEDVPFVAGENVPPSRGVGR